MIFVNVFGKMYTHNHALSLSFAFNAPVHVAKSACSLLLIAAGAKVLLMWESNNAVGSANTLPFPWHDVDTT